MIALFVNFTPFGSPVVPLVYIIVQMSSFFLGGSLQFTVAYKNKMLVFIKVV